MTNAHNVYKYYRNLIDTKIFWMLHETKIAPSMKILICKLKHRNIHRSITCYNIQTNCEQQIMFTYFFYLVFVWRLARESGCILNFDILQMDTSVYQSSLYSLILRLLAIILFIVILKSFFHTVRHLYSCMFVNNFTSSLQCYCQNQWNIIPWIQELGIQY